MLSSFKKLALALAVTTAFGVSASPAAAAIVRTSAGVLAADYVQTITPPSGGSLFWSSIVRYTPTNTVVCFQLTPMGGNLTCNAVGVAGYTKTGNGWEVTTP
jgi:hypothetical protein